MKIPVTGLGIVSSVGVGRDAFASALVDVDAAARRAFGGTPTVVSKETAEGARVAEVWGFDPATYLGAKGHRNFDRLTKMMIVAAKHALEDAGIKREGQFVAMRPERVGVCAATAYGSLEEITELNRVAELEDPRYINPTRFPNTVINSAAGYVSIWEDLRAPNTTLADGNAGALDAVLHASMHLGEGRADAFVVGGGEVLTEALVLAFRKLGITEGPGFALGEGAAFLVMESPKSAAERGVAPLGHVLGFGSAFEAPEREAEVLRVSGDAVERAILDALADAGLPKGAIGSVVGSASGIDAFDREEMRGVRAVFGEDVAYESPKTFLGETFGASGAFGLATALLRLRASNDARPALVLASGYYGNVTAVVVSAP